MYKYNDEIIKIISNAEMEMYNLNHPYVGSEHLLLSLLKDKDIKKITNQYDLTYQNIKDKLIKTIGKSNIKSKYVLYTPTSRLLLSKSTNKYDLLKEILLSNNSIAKNIINLLNIDTKKVIESFTLN